MVLNIMDQQRTEENFKKCSTMNNSNVFNLEMTTGREQLPELRLQKDVEWTFYPDGYHYGKRCYINGQRKGNCQTTKEITLVDIIGKSRKGINSRGGLPMVTSGDKSYSVPEYSCNFHKVGSTLPAINFSRSSKPISDTFIPLQPLERKKRRTYRAKKKELLEAEERRDVMNLSKWRPSPILTPSL